MSEQELDLPKGWVETNIDSIAKIIHYGYTATSTKEDTGTKYLRITDIQNNHVNWNDVPFCKIPNRQSAPRAQPDIHRSTIELIPGYTCAQIRGAKEWSLKSGFADTYRRNASNPIKLV